MAGDGLKVVNILILSLQGLLSSSKFTAPAGSCLTVPEAQQLSRSRIRATQFCRRLEASWQCWKWLYCCRQSLKHRPSLQSQFISRPVVQELYSIRRSKLFQILASGNCCDTSFRLLAASGGHVEHVREAFLALD